MLSKTPLRLILIVPFVVQITAAVGLTAWLSIRNGQKAVHDVATQLLGEISTLTRDRIPTYLEIPRQLNTIHVNNVELGHIDITRNVRTLSPYLIRSLQSFEQVSFTVFANPQGHYIGVMREADDTLRIEVIDDATDGRLRYYSTNEQGDFVQRLQNIDVSPEEILRCPWYKAAVEAQSPIWCEDYTTGIMESLAIAAAHPVYDNEGDLLGVFSTPVALEQISQFLESITIGYSGQVFIVDSAGRLIATSTGERLYRVVNRNGIETKELLQATESRNPLTRATAKALLNQVGHPASINTVQHFELITNHEHEFVQVTPLPEYTDLDWRIVVVALEADFMAQIRANTRNTIWLCLGALALATGSSILTAHWITRPLLQLNQAIREITRGNLQPAQLQGAIATNRIREVSELSRSFSQMTQQLQAAFAALQQSEATKQEVLDAIPDLLVWMKTDGTCEGVAASDSVIDVLLPGTAIGGNQYDELPSHIAELRRQAIAEMMRTGQVQHYEQVIDFDGSKQYEEVRVVPLETDRVLVIIRNITDLKETEQALKIQRDFNELIANIASRFVDLSPTNLDTEIMRALQDIAEGTGVDSSYVFQINEAAQTFSMSHEWCQQGYPRQIEQVQNIPFSAFPWGIATLKQRDLICVSELANLPEDASVDRASWQRFNIVSVLVVPLVHKSKVTGFMGFASFSQPMIWDAEIVRLLQVMGQTIANAQESVQTQAALIESEARWQFALEGSGQGMWDWDLQTNQVQWNEIHFELLGLSAETSTVEYNTWRERVHPDDVEGVEAATRIALGTQTTYEAEYRVLHLDGSVHWLVGRGRALYDDAGQPVRMIGVLLDITARKLAEQSLRENEQWFVTLAQALPVTIFQLNAAYECVYVNSRWSQMTGQPAGAALGVGWVEVLHPDDRDRLMREWVQWVQNTCQQGLYQNEGRVMRPDGSTRWYYIQALPLTDGDIVTGYIGTLIDISDRKQAEAALIESEGRFRALADSAPMFIWVSGIDGLCTFFNQTWLDFTGRTLEQNIGNGWTESIHPNDVQQCLQVFQTAHHQKQPYQMEYRLRRADGEYRWTLEKGTPRFDPDGEFIGLIGSCVDIHDRKQAETQLQDLTDRLGLAIKAADMGIWEWDMVNNRLHWDEQMFELYNVCPEDFDNVYKAWQVRVHPDDLPAIHAMEQKAWVGEQDYAIEFRIIWPNGTIHYIASYALVQRDKAGKPTRMVGANLDISDRKQAEEQLIYSALHDALTDLPNRTLLISRLESAIQRAQRSPAYHFAVLFLDLDQFKVINDSLGHLVGDELLLTVAQKLESIIRPTDLAARLGGDEFVILLEHIPDIQAVIHMVERLLTEFDGATMIDGHNVFVTTSIGIVWGTNTYTEASDLLRDADIALYRAKAKGRGRYEIFDAEMHVQAVKRMTLEHDLRIAIAQQEFITYYQPIIDLHTQQLTGFEALIRWQHPTRGFISPADFIPVAEETGMIMPISQWILQSACEQVATWQQQFPDIEALRISINLSGHDLRQPTLIETIRQTLIQAQLPTTSLTLEITESMLIENIESTIDLLEQLRDLGVRISIDDFGTGYSSLSYLYNLPADYLKIDQSFVSNMQSSDKNYKIVQAVISLSDQLQLAAIAEGIETVQQLEWLRELGCEFGQGYLLSRPLPPEAAEKLLSAILS